ncbi:methyl-accepting chemotaxis protein [Desulfothermus sp.]
MGIRTRVLIVLLSMFFISVILAVTTLVVVYKQKSDGVVINLAGRQRMLSQKMSKEVLELLYVKNKGEQGNKEKEGLLKSIKVFDVTLNALIASGYAPLTLDPNGPQQLLPPAHGQALIQLKKVKKLWTPMKQHILKVVKDLDKSSIEYVLDNNIKLLKEMNKGVFLLQKQADKKVMLLKIISILSIIIGVFIILLVGSWIKKSVVDPIVSLAMFAQEVGKEYSEQDNSLDNSTATKQSNELELLDAAMHNMVEKLREEIKKAQEASEQSEIMAKEAEQAKIEAEEALKVAQENEKKLRALGEKIYEVSDRIASSSEELSTEADQVVEGANIQKQRVVETATAMEEMNATVLEVAKNAAAAAESADNAKDRAEKGAEIVDQAVTAINEINVLAEKLKDNMEVLKQKADGISQVMTVISDIADQTNLLALNAAIEAARAGDAGKGFAVVADEVRKLAEKTMNATKEVGDAINEIQEEVNKDFQVMEDAAASVAKGTELSQQSKLALQEIVELVVSISDQIRAIATASEEQSAASDEITRAINEINEISDATVGNIEETRRAIQDFVVMAGELKQLVDKLMSD